MNYRKCNEIDSSSLWVDIYGAVENLVNLEQVMNKGLPNNELTVHASYVRQINSLAWLAADSSCNNLERKIY